MSQPHSSAHVAVTGIGLLTPLGDDPAAIAMAMNSGRSSVEECAEAALGARLRDFDARRYANVRGMRVYPRNTQLQICAATLALRDAGLEPSQIDPLELGTVTASTYAHMETLLEYDRGLVTVGIQRTNPTLFPLALPSAPGALTALSLGARAFAITVSDGAASGLAALGVAERMLAQGRAAICVVVGAFTHCAELSLSATRAGMLTDGAGFRVLDRRSRGSVFGELAAALVLERPERAHARGKEPLGYVRGHAASFASEPALRERALLRACRAALAAADSSPGQLSLVCSGASGAPESDAAEARALHELLGESRERVAITAPKSQLGESLDASGLVQAASALLSLRSGMAPPILGLEQPAVPGLRYLRRAGELVPGCSLLTSTSPTGACSALLLSVNHE